MFGSGAVGRPRRAADDRLARLPGAMLISGLAHNRRELAGGGGGTDTRAKLCHVLIALAKNSSVALSGERETCAG